MTSRAQSPAPLATSLPAAALPAAPRRRWRVLAVVALMLVPLAGVAVYLVLVQPFADAVGGCGGG